MLSGKSRWIKCTICKSSSVSLTSFTTTQDNLRLGDYSVFQCHSCHNAFTYPKVLQKSRKLSPDVPPSDLDGYINQILSIFTQIRVKIALGTTKSDSIRKLRVLDIGGGSCKFANRIVKMGASVTVIEPNVSNKMFAIQGVEFIPRVLDRKIIDSLSFRKKPFDVVTMWHSLEHCPNPKEICLLANKILKKDGRLVVVVPNFNSLQIAIGKNYWAYLDVPHHLVHFTQKGLDLLLSQTGYKLKKSHGFSLEYDLFGWQQTLVNLITGSHNYFYNKVKKNLKSQSLTYPRWTSLVSTFQIILLPVTLILSIISSIINRPSCLVCIYQKKG